MQYSLSLNGPAAIPMGRKEAAPVTRVAPALLRGYMLRRSTWGKER